MKILDLTGQRFGMLTALSVCGRNASKLKLWMCVCDCGNIKAVSSHDLRTGNTKSCGCLAHKGNLTHGMSRTSEHGAWSEMRKRCTTKTSKRFPLYGGRGISICERWSKFENFLADMGPKPTSQHTLDRIDVNGNYSPENCRWADWKTQQNNRRNNRVIEFNGEKLTSSQWQDRVGIPSSIIRQRLDRDGWSVEKAMTHPIGERI